MPAHRKPTAVLKRNGAFKRNPKRAAERKHEPAPNGPIGPPPASLTPKQLECWDEIIANSPEGVLAKSDRVVVEIAARLLALVRSKAKASAAIVSLLGQNLQRLGMTPADRSRVAAPGAPPPKSPWERIDNPSGFDARTN